MVLNSSFPVLNNFDPDRFETITDTFVGMGDPKFEATRGKRSGEPHHLRVGEQDIISHNYVNSYANRIPTGIPGEFTDVTLVNMRGSALSNRSLIVYSALAAAAVKTIDVKGKVVVELGSADGLQSLIALRNGATAAFAVDIEESHGAFFYENLALNGISRDSALFRACDITDTDTVRSTIPLDCVDVVIANLGPHAIYGNAHMAAIGLLEFMPNARVYLAGGYAISEQFNAKGARAALENYGFTNFRRITEGCRDSPRFAFIVER